MYRYLMLVGGFLVAAGVSTGCGDGGSDSQSAGDEVGAVEHAIVIELDDGRKFYDGEFAVTVRETEPGLADIGAAGYDLDGLTVYRFRTTVARPLVFSSIAASIPGASGGVGEQLLAIECNSEECQVAREVAAGAVSGSFALANRNDATGRIDDLAGSLSADVHGPWAFRCLVQPATLGLSGTSLIGDSELVTQFCQDAFAELGVEPSIQDASE